jgi:hypothetical protein
VAQVELAGGTVAGEQAGLGHEDLLRAGRAADCARPGLSSAR